jgi:hypothetical protein
MRAIEVILAAMEAKYFSQAHWTPICPTGLRISIGVIPGHAKRK